MFARILRHLIDKTSLSRYKAGYIHIMVLALPRTEQIIVRPFPWAYVKKPFNDSFFIVFIIFNGEIVIFKKLILSDIMIKLFSNLITTLA